MRLNRKHFASLWAVYLQWHTPSFMYVQCSAAEEASAAEAVGSSVASNEWDSSDPRFVFLTSDSKVKKRVISAGVGACPLTGDRVVVHYTGTFRQTGAVFDTSRRKSEPFAFELGRGQVNAVTISVDNMTCFICIEILHDGR